MEGGIGRQGPFESHVAKVGRNKRGGKRHSRPAVPVTKKRKWRSRLQASVRARCPAAKCNAL
eukprot:863066-Pleurochrysis_carterae.AAC.4